MVGLFIHEKALAVSEWTLNQSATQARVSKISLSLSKVEDI